MAGNTSKDRLLTSEIAELQARLQTLLKDNHELRQELSKIAGVDLSRFRSGHKVSITKIPFEVLIRGVVHLVEPCMCYNFNLCHG